MENNKGRNTLIKFSLAFSIIAFIISIMTFFKTGGMSDIKKQIYTLKEDVKEAKLQSEMRMENRSILLDALYNMADSVDSLKTGNLPESKRLIDEAIEKIIFVEKKVTEKKREQLRKIRGKIEKICLELNKDDVRLIEGLEYQIILLRIFEENL